MSDAPSTPQLTADDAEAERRGDPARTPRHFVSYVFFTIAPEWRRLPAEERHAQREEFAEVVDGWSDRMMVRTFSTVGVRADAEILIWRATPEFDDLQRMQTDLLSTKLGAWLTATYVYTATTKPSEYTPSAKRAGFRRPRPLDVVPIDAKYLIVYPFEKKREWYALSYEERAEAMREHAMVGRDFPTIKLNTAYSFGIDDQEFMVAFETDSVHDFLDLMMALRSTTASQFTARDTPIFTCTLMPTREAIDALGGSGLRSGVPAHA